MEMGLKSRRGFATIISIFCLLTLSWAQQNRSPLVFNLQSELVTDTARTDRLSRRANPGFVSQALDNAQVLYYANVTIGTPGQSFRLDIDSDSSDTWVNFAGSAICKNNGCQEGSFTPNASSTYKYINSNFSVTYGDGTQVQGDYVSDTIRINGQEIPGLQFGVGYNSSSSASEEGGILALGYIGLESVGQASNQYANLPVLMYQQNIIDCIAWSLWLDSSNATTGQLILGGVDNSKFYGTLQTTPVVMNQLQYSYVSIEMQGLSMTLGDNTTIVLDNQTQQVSPDSGTTGIYLPDNMTNPFYEHVGATYDSSVGGAVMDCNKADNATTLDFTFGTTTISVPLGDMLVANPGAPQNESCFLLLGSSEGIGLGLLGISFIRHSYIVYDFSHNQLSLAPAVFRPAASNITAIGPNGVGNLQGVVLSSTTEGNSTGTNSTGSLPANTSHGLSTGAKAGIGVGVALGVLLLLGIAVFLLLRRHRKSKKIETEKTAGLVPQGDGYTKPELAASSGYRPLELETSNQPFHTPVAELEAQEKPRVPQELATGNSAGHELEGSRAEVRRKPVPQSTGSELVQ